MINRSFTKALMISLTALTVLPLTGCTPESINAVTSLLKDASVRQGAAAQTGPAQGQTQTQTQTQTQPGGQTGPEGKPMTQPQPVLRPEQKPEIQSIKPQPVMNPCARAIVKIRFGQFKVNPASPLTAWKGGLKIENGKMRLLHSILFEKGDLVGMNNETSLSWQTMTRPHYDGFVVMLKAMPDSPEPKLIVHTNFGDKVFSFHELAHLNDIKRVDRFGNQFQISAYLLPPKPDSCGDDASVQEDPAFAYPDENQEIVEDQAETAGPAIEPTEVSAAAEASAEAQL